MTPADIRGRLASSFNELVAVHSQFREQAGRPRLLVDQKVAVAEQQALARRMALAQQQALLAIMESQLLMLAALFPEQTQRAGADRPNGGLKPS